MTDEEAKLPRAGATLQASQVYCDGPMDHRFPIDEKFPLLSPFVLDEHDDYWSICAGLGLEHSPVQKHTQDGWVAAVFTRCAGSESSGHFTDDEGLLRIAAPGETYKTPDGQEMVACTYRRGVRWEFKVLPQGP